MTQKILKKFLSDEVINYFDDQIESAEQLALLEKARAESEEASIRSELASAAAEALAEAMADSDAKDALKLAEAKEYAELKAAEVRSEILGGVPSELLDTIKEISDALENEQTVTGIILTQLTDLGTEKADITALDAAVASLSSDIALGDQTEAASRATAVADAVLESKAYTDTKISEIPVIDLTPYETIASVDLKTEATLSEAKTYTDEQIAAIPVLDISGKADISYVDSQTAALQLGLDDLARSGEELRSDVTDHESRIVTVEAKHVPVPKQKFFLIDETSELSYLDLGELAMDQSLVVFYNINVIRPVHHFTVSTVSGQTRLTWVNSLVPGQDMGVEVNDEFFVSYMV
jgi:hypothetical protein